MLCPLSDAPLWIEHFVNARKISSSFEGSGVHGQQIPWTHILVFLCRPLCHKLKKHGDGIGSPFLELTERLLRETVGGFAEVNGSE